MNINYYGYDAYNKIKFPKYNFKHLDFINDKEILEPGDLCIIKDTLMHLPNRDIFNILDYIISNKMYKNFNYKLLCTKKNYQNYNLGKMRKLTAKMYPLKKYDPEILMYYKTKEISCIDIK